MPRNDGNSRNKRSRKKRKNFKSTEEPEPPKEELIAQQDSRNKEKSSLGSGIFTERIIREQDAHRTRVQEAFAKALKGAGDWKKDPAKMRRLLELRKQAENRGSK